MTRRSLRERVPLEVEAPRILRRQVDLEAQRRADAAERGLVGAGERVVPALRSVTARAHEAATRRGRATKHPLTAIDSTTRWRTATPIRVHTAATARPEATTASAASTTSSRTSPCWNIATITGGV